jgi:galactosylceramidase
MIANSPWSGHYRTREVLWGYAHYGQFSEVGWTYLNGAYGTLAEGGSFVTLKSPGNDYSVILETKGAKAAQSITFNVSGGLAVGPVGVWRSNAKEQFVQQPSITPDNGRFTLNLEPDTIYSISTTSGQQKAAFADVPADQKFPFPYYETFDQYTAPKQSGYLPRYTADIAGVFEIVDRPDRTGKCLRQVTAQKPQSWAPEWMPYTIIGDAGWQDYEVSADVLLANGGWAGVMGRIVEVGTGYGTEPKGYYLRLSADGICTLVASNGKEGGEELGDKEHQERLRAEAAAGQPDKKGEKQMGGVALKNFSQQAWHNVKLRFSGTAITGFVDGEQVVSATNKLSSHGMVGLITGDDTVRSTAYFDNLLIAPVGGGKPSPSPSAAAPTPIY